MTNIELIKQQIKVLDTEDKIKDIHADVYDDYL